MYADSNNFDEIYTEYYWKSFLFVKSYVHDDFVAKDLVSEAMIKLWDRMNRMQINQIQPYLFTILKNSALDYLKHEAIKSIAHDSLKELLDRELRIRISVLQASDPKEIFSSEIQNIVRSTLGNLPSKTRQAFEMSRYQHKANKEIAEVLGITVKGVDYHMAIAMKVLKTALKDYLSVLVCFFHMFFISN